MLKVSKIVLSLFVVSSIALANPTKDMNSLDISKNDKEFLFGTNNANIVALNDKEMKNTDGKWVGVAAKAIKHIARAVGFAATHPSTANGNNKKNKNKK